MKKIRTFALTVLLLLCFTLLFACNDAPDLDGDGGKDPTPDGENSGENGGNSNENGGESALSEYGDNVVDYDALFGGNDND